YHDPAILSTLKAAEEGHFSDSKGASGLYLRLLHTALQHPLQVLGLAIAVLVATIVLSGPLGHGDELSPDVDSDVGMVDIRARGNLSLQEREQLVLAVERRIFDMAEIQSIYTTTFIKGPNAAAADLIGRIQIELVNWQQRRPTEDILADIEQRTASLA